MIRVFDAPIEQAASTNSRLLSDRTWPRTIRAMNVQLMNAMTTMTTLRPGLTRPPTHPWPSEHADAIPSASRRIGKASSTSTSRERRVSTQPP